MFRQNQLASGVLLVLGINFLSAATVFILTKILPGQLVNNNYNFIFFVVVPFFWLIGLTQFLYIIPLIIWLLVRRQGELIKGVIIGAVITILLNGGGCFLLSNGFKV